MCVRNQRKADFSINGLPGFPSREGVNNSQVTWVVPSLRKQLHGGEKNKKRHCKGKTHLPSLL